MNKNETIADIRKEAEARFRELLEKRVDSLGHIQAMQQFNQVFDRIEAVVKRERDDEMLDALVRIGNWCAQDLGENAYISDSSGNYLKTLNGLCDICRPFMQEASRLKRYGGVE